VDSLSVILIPFFFPAHFLSAAKENGKKNAGRGKPQHPRSQNKAPHPSGSGLRTVARKVKRQNIRNSKSLLLTLITVLERRRFFLPKIKKHLTHGQKKGRGARGLGSERGGARTGALAGESPEGLPSGAFLLHFLRIKKWKKSFYVWSRDV
jgi:hypothetical protein